MIDMEFESTAREIFSKINEVRTNPKKIANKIAFMMSYINKRDNTLREPNKNSYKLIEGIRAFEEAITFLKNMEPVEELIWEDFMSKVSKEEASEISKRGLNMYESNDLKLKYTERFKKFGTFTNLQDILLFTDSDSLHLVIDLIICDGDITRANRNLILSTTNRQIGVAIEDQNRVGHVCVIYLARNFKLRSESMQSNKIPVTIPEENKILQSKNILCETNEGQLDSKSILSKNNCPNEYDELIAKYEKELDNEIKFDDYEDKTEEKQFILEGQILKIIKKIKFSFSDGNMRTVFLSKSVRLNKID